MKQLDPFTIPLESINLIEASAGTGKSWTVTLLYLRLILEKDLKVEQILVVTFTEAATKELRDKIRERLIEAMDFVEARIQNPDATPEEHEKQEYQKIYENLSIDPDEAIQRLNRAKLSLDEAAVFTIHGFCQRVLSENAFATGLAFESELMDDDSELMQKLTDDFWRRRFQTVPNALLFKLQQKSITPDSLLKDIKSVVGKPYLEICGPEKEETGCEDVQCDNWHKLEAFFQQTIAIWDDSRDELVALLSDPGRDKEYYKYLKDYRDEIFSEMEFLSVSKFLPTTLNKTRMSWLGSREKTTAKFESIEHPFFEQWQAFLDLWEELDKSSGDFIAQIRIDLLKYLQQELPKEKQRLGVLSFDDLLLNLQRALKETPGLADTLRQKYKAALVDEFQDTDPVQYDIFSTIYDKSFNNPVFLVGDPKQAIYSFRGGDIHTYLKAKKDTPQKNHFTLNTNWRSHPQLIAAFNVLYARSENPFQDRGIDYVKVNAGKEQADDLLIPAQRSPLRFWQCFQAEGENAAGIKQRIAHSVAGDIANVLNAGNAKNDNKALLQGKPVSGGDIAVLVRSHTQGNLIKLALGERQIASVQSSRQTIFETHEASEMLRLLAAIIEPQREDEVRRALVTEMLGYCAKDLLRFEEDSNAWEEKLLLMQTWHVQWKKRGFLPMMRSLMQTEKVHQRLLAYNDGERRLSNLLHLSELIHRASKQQSLGLEELIRWLKQQQESASTKEAELRLESDENLVKIVTIHKSKGLEYPIIYCPFVGMGGVSFKDPVYTFHKQQEDHTRVCLEIGSADAAEHKKTRLAEESAEDTRLLYVALTRAKYKCTLVCFPDAINRNPDKTALGWLMTNGKTSNTAKQKKEFHGSYHANLTHLLSQSNGNITLDELPYYPGELKYQPIESEQTLSARSFTAKIKPQAQITSFSGLTAALHTERADHDHQFSNAVTSAVTLPSAAENEFPRGAKAGSALHEVYEHLDFTTPVNEQQDIVLEGLNKWGFNKHHADAANLLMENSLSAEMFEDFSLNQLEKNQRLNEMEFYLPLKRLQIEDLKQILFKYLPHDKENKWQVVRDALNTLSFEQVEGYLKGFIDLIFEHQGKFYLVDYKSNSLADYAPENLLPAMTDSHYYLQYLLYSVALHRYLQKRISDYSWEMHMGGVYYLFIRGMSPQSHGRGVFFDKPGLDLIEALDGLFLESLL